MRGDCLDLGFFLERFGKRKFLSGTCPGQNFQGQAWNGQDKDKPECSSLSVQLKQKGSLFVSKSPHVKIFAGDVFGQSLSDFSFLSYRLRGPKWS